MIGNGYNWMTSKQVYQMGFHPLFVIQYRLLNKDPVSIVF